MNKNIEKEFKVLVDKEKFYELLSFYPAISFKKQVNIYYDTQDHQILKNHGAMRIRTKNTHVFTFKKATSNGLEEYECTVSENSVSALYIDEITFLLKSHNISGPFEQIANLTTYRGVLETEYAELCFDINEYNGITDYEIEYEYKKDHDGIKAFNDILAKINIEYKKNGLSKIERAIRSKN